MTSQQVFLRKVVLRFAVLVAATLGVNSLFGQAAPVVLATLAPAALAGATDMGPVPAAQKFSLTLTVAPNAARKAALGSFLTALTTPGSGSYHQWVTPAQFAERFGADADDLAAVSAWARGAGLTVGGVSAGGTRMTLTGTAAQVETAVGVQVDVFSRLGYSFYAPVGQPVLPMGLSGVVVGISGLSNAPSEAKAWLTGPAATPATTVNGVASVQDVATLGALVDANQTAMLALDSTAGVAALTQSDVDAFGLLFEQAAAQGMTTILGRSASSLGFPSSLPEVTALALAGDLADQQVAFAQRPAWQSVTGLPPDGLRHGPDVTSTLSEFTAAMTEIAGGTRLGNINQVLYELAPIAGLYSGAGSWTAAGGLGVVDVHKLGKVYPRGTGMSYTSIKSTNYSPSYGQSFSLVSVVTSGTGGATPTGTVQFVTNTGVVLGTVMLVNGTATLTETNLDSNTYIIDAVYSGDGTYASSMSPTTQLYVAPENTVLSAQIGGNPTIGGSYTVTVTDTDPSGTGTPAGPVTVTVSGTGAVYSANLAPSGTGMASATVTIPATTAGTLTLQVTCTTTQDYACNNPYTTNVTINKATPVLSISSNPTTLVSGQQVTLKAVVSTVGNAVAPTGAVTFFDNGTTLNAAQLNNDSAQTTGTVPTTPTHTLSATYAGDSNYNSVSTTAGSTTSGTITTSLLLQANASTVTAGQTITFMATLTAASTGPAAPTGTVMFFDGSTALGTANLAGNVATFSTAGLSATTNHTITAVYSGDGYYTASTSNAVGLSGNNTSTATATQLTISPTNPVHGSTVTLTATVSATGGGTAPTGTVTFTNANTGTLGTAPLSNGVATLQTSQLMGGTSTFTASYGGSATYNASFSNSQTVTVSPEPVQLTITPPANATFGSALTVTVTVVGASGVSYPTGTVTVTPQGSGYSASSSASVTSGGTNSTGSASVIVQAAGAGPVTFTATYTGDKNFAAAGPVSTNVTVAKATSTTTVSFSPTVVTAGQPTMVTAHVGFVSSIAPTGTVQFFDGAVLLGTGTLGTNGSATLTTTFAAGNQVVTAVYSGDGNYAGSTSAPANTNPGTTASTTVLMESAGTVAAGGSVTLTVSVGPAGTPQPTGAVQILSGTTVVCTVSLTGATGSCVYSPATAGTYGLTANYLGDGNFAASSSGVVPLTVTGTAGTLVVTTTSLTAAPSATVTGATTLTATVVPATPTSRALTGTVSFYDGTTLLGTATASVAAGSTTGVATLTVTLSTATTHALTAVYSGDKVYAGSTSTVVTSLSGRIATVTTLAATGPAATGGMTTLAATIVPVSAGAATLTGTVAFYDGTVLLGTSPVTVATGTTSGTATLAVTLSTTVAHTITAVYSGDTVYAGSTSTAITGITTVTKITPVVTLVVAPTTGVAGSAVVLTATVAGVTAGNAVPTGTVTFYAVSAGGTTNLGTATLGASGAGAAVATLSTVGIPAGAASVYAVYAGDGNFATVMSNVVAIGQGSYSLTFTPQSLTLFAGQTGISTIIVNAVNGFTGSLVFGCSVPGGAGITCSVSPTTLAGSGQVALTVTTVAPMAKGSQVAGLSRAGRTGGWLGGMSLAAALCWLLPAGRRRRFAALAVALVGLSLAAGAGCSDNSFTYAAKTGGTPLGTSVLTITTAVSNGTTTVRQTYPFQVTVQ